jgi:glycosyltransferase involved in cell wall biosynthesis
MEISQERETFIIYIDLLRVENRGARELLIAGWAGNFDFSAFHSIVLEAGDNRTPLRMGIARSDVAMKFDSQGMANPGFAGRIYLTEDAKFFRLTGMDSHGETLLLTEKIPPEAEDVPEADLKRNSYQAWLHRQEPALFWRAEEIPTRMRGLRNLPLISVIVPTYNTDPYHLYRCVYSLLMQHYQNWQLCIADDGSRDPATLRMLREFSGIDPRIRIRLNPENSGISAASMLAAEMAEGEFIVLLDHDDELHRHALLEITRQINLTPDVDLIYSDEDKIDEIGRRTSPAFKPDFDQELLLAFSYIGHIVCVRAGVFRAVGGLRSSFNGAQDWDLLIRVSEAVDATRVRHIPKPLYHWRMHPESTSMNLDSKPFSQAAWQRVLEDYLRRRNIGGEVQKGLFLGSMRIHREKPENARTAVILRLEDGSRQYAMARRARLPQGMKFYESYLTTLHDLDTHRMVLRANDLDADFIIFINIPLDRLNHFFYEELISQCSRPGFGLVGGVTVNVEGRGLGGGLDAQSDGSLLNAFEGMQIGALGYMGRFRVVHTVAAVAPYFFAVRTDVFETAGGLARLNTDRGSTLCQGLAEACPRLGMKALFTPYAIATALTPFDSQPIWNEAIPVPAGLALNPNLRTFPDTIGALRHGI